MSLFGVGAYTPMEAGRLLDVPPSTLRHWLFGYSYDHHGPRTKQEPLWTPQYGLDQEDPILGFRDLLEARIVRGFRNLGLSLPKIRAYLSLAREITEDDHPFSSSRFRSDGATLFLEANGRLLDLQTSQRVFREVVAPSFKDLDFDTQAACRWWLIPNKRSILIDPERAFGQPIAAKSGILTSRLVEAVEAEGSIERVSRLYDVSTAVVRDALAFEQQRGRKLAA